ncbi:glycosyltransferase family 39 protein [Candidatus Woesearchaeota archaeon]|nr:glycosyltransferase family 39 protein [Candidatus Woesearchaeota archaeon]
MNKKHLWILTAIFVLTLLIRLWIAFSQPTFTYESYFHLRNIEAIRDTGLPLFNDPLSYGGRELRFLPLFHYTLAIPSLIMPIDIAAILFSNLYIALLTIIVYLIVRQVTKNEEIPLICAGLTGILPFLFTPNSITPETLFIPLIFLTIYTFLKIKEPNYIYFYILLFFASCLTSSATIFLILSFLIYYVLNFIENKKVPPEESEIILFSIFFFIWIQLIFFKQTFLTQGLSFIWQNIPLQIVQQYFPHSSLIQIMLSVTIIPFLTGVYVVYQNLFYARNNQAIIIISSALAISLLTFFRFMKLNFALSLFSIILIILFAFFYEEIIEYTRKTKLSKKITLISVVIIFVVIATILPATITAPQRTQAPLVEEIEALKWLDKSVDDKAGVVSLLEEGNMVTYFAKHPNLMDEQFTLIPDVEQRFKDLRSLYTTSFQTQAIELLEKYGMKYLVLTPRAQETYGITNFRYFEPSCFEPIYSKEVKIYKVKCTLESTVNQDKINSKLKLKK